MAKKLFVGSLEWGVTDQDLQQLFEQISTVEEAVVIKDRFSGRSKGFGFVTFADTDEMTADEAADKAIAELEGADLNGRQIVVNEAKPREPRDN